MSVAATPTGTGRPNRPDNPGPTPVAADAELRLIPLTAEEIGKAWPDLQAAFIASLPPTRDPLRLQRLLYACLAGDLQVYIAAEVKPVVVAGAPMLHPRRRVVAVLVTTVQRDWIEGDGAASLFIYALYGLVDLDASHVRQGWDALCRIARAKGCRRVAAVTKSDGLVKMALGFGGEVEHHRVGIPVPDAATADPTAADGGPQ